MAALAVRVSTAEGDQPTVAPGQGGQDGQAGHGGTTTVGHRDAQAQIVGTTHRSAT